MDRYSTLESHYSQLPEVVPVEQGRQDGVQEVDATQKEHVPDDTQAPEPVPNQQYHYNATPETGTVKLLQSADGRTVDEAAIRSSGRQRICGLGRRTFFILLGVVLLVLAGAIAGGVAGGLASRKSSSTGGQVITPNRVNVMDISSLSASNWTDGNGFDHRIVFFQDPWNAVVARRWDSQNNTWATTNISAVSANSATPLVAAPGTSLAGVALDWPNAYNIRLYFLDPTDTIRSTFSDSPMKLPDLWKNDTMSSSNINVLHGSKLAATWARSSNSTDAGLWTLAWQGANEGFIKVGNVSDFSTPVDGLNGNKVAGNTSLALVPQYGGAQDNMGLISQSFNSGTSGSMQVNAWNETWAKNPSAIIPNVPLPAQYQHIAAGKWGDWTKTLCYALLADGTMRGTWWQDVADQNVLSSISLNGGPAANFTAIAMTLDAMFYGVSGDEIHEYGVDTSDPAKLNYVGRGRRSTPIRTIPRSKQKCTCRHLYAMMTHSSRNKIRQAKKQKQVARTEEEPIPASLDNNEATEYFDPSLSLADKHDPVCRSGEDFQYHGVSPDAYVDSQHNNSEPLSYPGPSSYTSNRVRPLHGNPGRPTKLRGVSDDGHAYEQNREHQEYQSYCGHALLSAKEEALHFGRDPVRLEVELAVEPLHWTARVDYSRLIEMTNESDVLFIGRIYEEDLDILKSNLDENWEDNREKHNHEHEVSRTKAGGF
ncbi:hypothetical protein SCUP234_03352 [Seiridium cupressi]